MFCKFKNICLETPRIELLTILRALVLKTAKTNPDVVYCLNCGAKLFLLSTEARARVEIWKKVTALK